MDKDENAPAAEPVPQRIDPAATSSETLSDIEANETAGDELPSGDASASPSPDGQFSVPSESVKDDPGPM